MTARRDLKNFPIHSRRFVMLALNRAERIDYMGGAIPTRIMPGRIKWDAALPLQSVAVKRKNPIVFKFKRETNSLRCIGNLSPRGVWHR